MNKQQTDLYKKIVAVVLVVVALGLLWYNFSGSQAGAFAQASDESSGGGVTQGGTLDLGNATQQTQMIGLLNQIISLLTRSQKSFENLLSGGGTANSGTSPCWNIDQVACQLLGSQCRWDTVKTCRAVPHPTTAEDIKYWSIALAWCRGANMRGSQAEANCQSMSSKASNASGGRFSCQTEIASACRPHETSIYSASECVYNSPVDCPSGTVWHSYGGSGDPSDPSNPSGCAGTCE